MKSSPSVIMQERTELALKASNEGVWDWFVNQKEIYYSERVLQFLGYDEDTAPNIFTEAKEYFHEEDLDGFNSALEHSLAGQTDDLFGVDCRYRHPDGDWHWLRIRGVVVHDDEGLTIRMVGSIIDISHRKRAEIALEEERYRLKQLIESVPVNVYYKDTESRFVLANMATIEKLGETDPDKVLGKTDHDFFDISHAGTTRSNELEIMQSQNPHLNEVHCETWEGKEDTWAKSSKLPWIDKKGNVCGTFGITSDITDLVNTQRMLTTVAKELKSRNVAFEEELQLARETQQALLPQELNGLHLAHEKRQADFACRYAPASEMAGDFYEFMPISDNKVGVLICDVMGHGVRASLIVSMLRGFIEIERDSFNHPAQFLQSVNNGLVSILNRSEATIFATALYCVIDLNENTLSYACAGHPAPIKVKRQKAEQMLSEGKKTSPALGLIPDAEYYTEQVSLDDIDRLLLYTDGLYEVENDEFKEFGITGIMNHLESDVSMSLDVSLDALLKKATSFSQKGEFEDDVCLIAININQS